MGFWSFLRGLWPWRKRPQPEPEPAPPPTPAAPPPESPEEAPASAPLPAEPAAPLLLEPTAEPAAPEPPAPVEPPSPQAGEAEQEEEEDEDAGWEDEDDEDPEAPDPFISGETVAEVDDVDLAERRSAARAAALSGEQRIYLSMPAGPGSLAEALEQLAAEGLVTSEFVAEGEDGPHILYRPVG